MEARRTLMEPEGFRWSGWIMSKLLKIDPTSFKRVCESGVIQHGQESAHRRAQDWCQTAALAKNTIVAVGWLHIGLGFSHYSSQTNASWVTGQREASASAARSVQQT